MISIYYIKKLKRLENHANKNYTTINVSIKYSPINVYCFEFYMKNKLKLIYYLAFSRIV